MAIDDNTLYGFKGSQVKTLVNNVKEASKLYAATGQNTDGAMTQKATTDALDLKADSADLATVATTGDYSDLINAPTIPVVNNATLTIQKNGAAVDTFTANASADKTINITVPVTAADVSALPASTKYGATITVTYDSATGDLVTTLKDQDGTTLGTAQTVNLAATSVIVSGRYDSTTQSIILTLQNGNEISIPVAGLVSGLQTEITSQNMLNADLVDDTTSAHKFVSAADKTAWDGKQDALTAGTNITISGTTISAADTTYSAFTGATTQDAGAAGLVPAPSTSDPEKFLKGDGTWGTPTGTTYSAGSGLDLTGTTFSVDTTTIQGKLTAGSNISIAADNTISATDTTYSDFTGTDGTAAGVAGLVPAPATTDAGKFLKADGTWSSAGGPYILPVATASTLGGVKIGTGISVTNDGIISASIPTATNQLTNNGSDGAHPFVSLEDLAAVAASGDYADLKNTPYIPAAQVNSDWNASSGVAQILNKPEVISMQDWNALFGATIQNVNGVGM